MGTTIFTPEHRMKLRLAKLGKKFSFEHKKNLSLSKIGNTNGIGYRHTEEWKKQQSLRKREEKAYQWKGDEVSYGKLHTWVRKYLGRPKECVYCGTRELKRKDGRNAIQYANVSRKYKRELTDWIPLCTPCHGQYDMGHKRNLII